MRESHERNQKISDQVNRRADRKRQPLSTVAISMGPTNDRCSICTKKKKMPPNKWKFATVILLISYRTHNPALMTAHKITAIWGDLRSGFSFFFRMNFDRPSTVLMGIRFSDLLTRKPFWHGAASGHVAVSIACISHDSWNREIFNFISHMKNPLIEFESLKVAGTRRAFLQFSFSAWCGGEVQARSDTC